MNFFGKVESFPADMAANSVSPFEVCLRSGIQLSDMLNAARNVLCFGRNSHFHGWAAEQPSIDVLALESNLEAALDALEIMDHIEPNPLAVKMLETVYRVGLANGILVCETLNSLHEALMDGAQEIVSEEFGYNDNDEYGDAGNPLTNLYDAIHDAAAAARSLEADALAFKAAVPC